MLENNLLVWHEYVNTSWVTPVGVVYYPLPL